MENPGDAKGEIDSLKVELATLREEIKERETSFLRGVKTLIQDLHSYHSGARTDFPRAALMGVIISYMTPRFILVIGSLVAVVATFLQVGLLYRQNELIEDQGKILAAQTNSTEFQAQVALLAMLDPRDPFKSGMAITLVQEYPEYLNNSLQTLAENSPDEIIGRFALFMIIQNAYQGSIDTVKFVELLERAELLLRSYDRYHALDKANNSRNERFDPTEDRVIELIASVIYKYSFEIKGDVKNIRVGLLYSVLTEYLDFLALLQKTKSDNHLIAGQIERTLRIYLHLAVVLSGDDKIYPITHAPPCEAMIDYLRTAADKKPAALKNLLMWSVPKE